MECLLNREKNKIEKSLENISIDTDNIDTSYIDDIINNLK